MSTTKRLQTIENRLQGYQTSTRIRSKEELDEALANLTPEEIDAMDEELREMVKAVLKVMEVNRRWRAQHQPN